MEFKKDVFKGIVLLKGHTLSDIADMLNINESTLYRKMRRNGDFSRGEIKIISDRLKLTAAEMNKIFFEE